MAIEAPCFSCLKMISFLDAKVGRREECPHCGADVHCCRNCQFYDPKAYNECREPSADRVAERDRSNHCDYFVLHQGKQGGEDKKAQLRAAAEALFKKR